jgi:hypothetical protein
MNEEQDFSIEELETRLELVSKPWVIVACPGNQCPGGQS